MRCLLIALLLFASPAYAQEGPLLAILKSDAPAKVKADACRELARVATRRAVPALAALLSDEQLSHMARYALEPIADPSVDAALRGALPRVKGRLLVGVISSLGARKDRQAIKLLSRYLTNTDPEVAQAAARAMGSIGSAAAPALQQALSTGPVANRPAVCEGLFRCAETMSCAAATAIYDRVRKVKNLPEPLYVAALWGEIRGRGRNGAPLLLKTIRTESLVPAAGAMQLAKDIPGTAMTRALIGELAHGNQEKRLLLLQALGHRGDPAASPALVPLARRGPANMRIAALRSLVQLGAPSSIPVLAALVKDPDASVSGAARSGLLSFPGKAVESAIVALLNDPDPGIRAMISDVAAQRRITSAVPALLKAACDSNAAVAGAGFRALGELAGVAEMPAMVEAMLGTRDVRAAEVALSAICTRQPDMTRCVVNLLPGLAKAQGEQKLALLRILGTAAGSQALAAVRAAMAEPGEAVRETALQVLCDWPTPEALPDLARIARTAPDTKTRILALRGQLRLIPLQNVPDAKKLEQLAQILPMIERKEEQIMALAALGQMPEAGSLALVMPSLTDGTVQEEANLAAVALAEKLVASHPAEAAEALNLVQTHDSQLAGRVRQLLARVPEGAIEAGFISLFNGKDLSGWDGKPGWWRVEDGALTAESTPEKPCAECNYLIWRGGQTADFELRARFKLSVSANSGIQIRSEERPNWDTFGYQADVTGDGGLAGFVYHHSRGLIAGRGERAVFSADGTKTVEPIGDPAKLLAHFRPGDWNTYRVVCRGSDITLYVNGVLMCHITDHHATQAAARGIIALQMHPGPPMKVQFKNLRIKELQ